MSQVDVDGPEAEAPAQPAALQCCKEPPANASRVPPSSTAAAITVISPLPVLVTTAAAKTTMLKVAMDPSAAIQRTSDS